MEPLTRLRVLEDQIFWNEVQAAFEKDPEMGAEAVLWDSTSGDGFQLPRAASPRAHNQG
jgi:hypothetical protein